VVSHEDSGAPRHWRVAKSRLVHMEQVHPGVGRGHQEDVRNTLSILVEEGA
jgi:hypothetical protein